MAAANGTGASSILAGLLVAVAAVIPMAWAVGSGGPGSSDTTVAPTTAAVIAQQVPEQVTETVVVVPGPVEVDGLPESIVRALEAAGNVREESGSELGLPESVISVLADNDVVLRVAEEPAP